THVVKHCQAGSLPLRHVDEGDVGDVGGDASEPLGEIGRDAQSVAGGRQRAPEQGYRLGVRDHGNDAERVVVAHAMTLPANTRRAGPVSVTSSVSRATEITRLP